jgi:hypothetical protein
MLSIKLATGAVVRGSVLPTYFLPFGPLALKVPIEKSSRARTTGSAPLCQPTPFLYDWSLQRTRSGNAAAAPKFTTRCSALASPPLPSPPLACALLCSVLARSALLLRSALGWRSAYLVCSLLSRMSATGSQTPPHCCCLSFPSALLFANIARPSLRHRFWCPSVAAHPRSIATLGFISKQDGASSWSRQNGRELGAFKWG